MKSFPTGWIMTKLKGKIFRISLSILCFVFSIKIYSQGYICAVGGGSENYNNWSDVPYRWMVEKSGNGAALVMHYSEGSSWLENYFKSFGALSAQSLVISNRIAADDSANYKKIIEAKLIFLRGGDQSRYYTIWKGTLVEKAIMKVFQDGGVIGGSSAGLAVLGGIDYTALGASAESSSCLANPFHRDITLFDDFLPFLPGVLFDSHFTARGRIGRLLAFVAQWNETHNADIIGIGMDERTAICIEPNGDGTVAGAGAAFIIHRNPQSNSRCEAGKPLFFTDWTLHSLTAGFCYNIYTRQLVRVPEKARALHPAPLPTIPAHATILLSGGTTPSEARSSLQTLVTAANHDTLLILGGKNGATFQSYLNTSLNALNVRLLTLTVENIQSDATAAIIRQHISILVAGFTTDEVNTLLTPSSAVQTPDEMDHHAAKGDVYMNMLYYCLPDQLSVFLAPFI